MCVPLVPDGGRSAGSLRALREPALWHHLLVPARHPGKPALPLTPLCWLALNDAFSLPPRCPKSSCRSSSAPLCPTAKSSGHRASATGAHFRFFDLPLCSRLSMIRAFPRCSMGMSEAASDAWGTWKGQPITGVGWTENFGGFCLLCLYLPLCLVSLPFASAIPAGHPRKP